MRQLFADLETWSTEPIANGSHRYAEKAEVMLWSFAIDDESVQVWDLTADPKPPLDLEAALADDSVEVWFQNGGHFDFVVLDHAMPEIHIAEHRRRDTMVQALSHSLPGALDKLGAALGLADDQRKIADGKRLVRLFCQPHTEKDGSMMRITAVRLRRL
jgi:DNA polymerase